MVVHCTNVPCLGAASRSLGVNRASRDDATAESRTPKRFDRRKYSLRRESYIRAAGSAEARAKLRAAEEPLFEQWRRQFFAVDQFPENADKFAIAYGHVFAELEAGAAPFDVI